jgi:hypothetical protein
MTMQTRDLFRVDKRQDLSIVSTSTGTPLFDPRAHFGLRRASMSTACWRGWVARYRVHKGLLVLDALTLALRNDSPPRFGEATHSRKSNGLNDWAFEHLEFDEYDIARSPTRPSSGIVRYRKLKWPLEFSGTFVASNKVGWLDPPAKLLAFKVECESGKVTHFGEYR